MLYTEIIVYWQEGVASLINLSRSITVHCQHDKGRTGNAC